MIKDLIKGNLCLYLIILIIFGLIPQSVSAQCGNCDDGIPCTVDYCNGINCEHDYQNCIELGSQTGSNYRFSSAGGTEAANSTSINQGTGFPGPVGYQLNMSCNDANPCTNDYYGPKGCFYEPVNCNDTNPFTNDYCTPRGCVHDPVSCDDANPCTNDRLSTAGCVYEPVICNDGDACTTDACTGGVCIYSPVVCDDGDACTTDACNNGECAYTPIVCDDGDVCTNDRCDPATGCASSPVICDDASPEVRSSCGCPEVLRDGEEGTSISEQNEVQTNETANQPENQTINLTQDQFNQTQDQFNQTQDQFNQTQDQFNQTQDQFNQTQNESNETVSESISSASLAGIVPVCDDFDPCTTDEIVDGKCKHFRKICDDHDISTFDYCYQGNCTHSTTNCNDGNICTVDSFNGTECIHIAKSCDDHNPCTNDFCDKVSGCHNVVIDNDNNACTIDCEDGKDVKKPLICNDGNPCTREYCDKVRGCVYVPVCGPIYFYPYGAYYPYYPYYPHSAYYPYSSYYPYATPTAPATPTTSAIPLGSASSASTSLPTESYTIPAKTVITLPWNDTVIALDALKVENGVASSSGSALRFSRQMGVVQSKGNMSQQAEMIGLSWNEGGNPFTLALTQPNGTALKEEDDDEKNILHLTGSNYDYYFLRDPVEGYWTVMVTPTYSAATGQGFSLISGLVEGIVSPDEED